MEKVKISTEYIKLDQFLKWVGEADSGSSAKMFIDEGLVKVNGLVEKRRGKKLRAGDVVNFDVKTYEICQGSGKTSCI
jgi:ribosome-associated protein